MFIRVFHMYMTKDKKALLKRCKRIQREKKLKAVTLKNQPTLRMKVGLMKMGFNVEMPRDH